MAIGWHQQADLVGELSNYGYQGEDKFASILTLFWVTFDLFFDLFSPFFRSVRFGWQPESLACLGFRFRFRNVGDRTCV